MYRYPVHYHYNSVSLYCMYSCTDIIYKRKNVNLMFGVFMCNPVWLWTQKRWTYIGQYVVQREHSLEVVCKFFSTICVQVRQTARQPVSSAKLHRGFATTLMVTWWSGLSLLQIGQSHLLWCKPIGEWHRCIIMKKNMSNFFFHDTLVKPNM